MRDFFSRLAGVFILGLSLIVLAACTNKAAGSGLPSAMPTITPEVSRFVAPSTNPDEFRLPPLTFAAVSPNIQSNLNSPPALETSPAPENNSPGRIYKAGDFDVVDLHGSYYQMGRQYGAFLSLKLAQLYPAMVEDYLIKLHGLTMQDIRNWVDPRYSLFPEKIKQFLQGTADASGLEMEKLIVLANFTDLARILPGSTGCSGIAAWGPYTDGGPLVFGRNFDWSGHYKNFDRFLTVTVFNPDDGSIPFASVAWAGELLVQTALNRAGIFLESNDGEISGGPVFLKNVIHPSIRSFSWMTDYGSLEQLDQALKAGQVGRAMIFNVADKSLARTYECTPSAIKLRKPEKEGLMVVTNHFLEPSWSGILPAGDAGYTETRYRNLETLAEKNKGKITPQVMMQILDTPLEKGGATHEQTVFQVIAVPEQLKIWLKAPGYSEWIEIDIKSLWQ